jgi:hypothetical protein
VRRASDRESAQSERGKKNMLRNRRERDRETGCILPRITGSKTTKRDWNTGGKTRAERDRDKKVCCKNPIVMRERRDTNMLLSLLSPCPAKMASLLLHPGSFTAVPLPISPYLWSPSLMYYSFFSRTLRFTYLVLMLAQLSYRYAYFFIMIKSGFFGKRVCVCCRERR